MLLVHLCWGRIQVPSLVKYILLRVLSGAAAFNHCVCISVTLSAFGQGALVGDMNPLLPQLSDCFFSKSRFGIILCEGRGNGEHSCYFVIHYYFLWDLYNL